MRIIEYPKVPSIANDDVLIVDGANGTRNIQVDQFYNGVLGSMTNDKIYQMYDDAGVDYGYRRNIYRGKNLGTSVTDQQWEEIRNGSFRGLFIGDYWTIANYTWRIADINYWLGTGDTACMTNHLVIMPDKVLDNQKMNATQTTEGGYVGSQLHQSGLVNSFNKVWSAFGQDHILKHREILTNAVTNGYPSGHAMYDSTVELPNEPMMYGSYIFAQVGASGNDIPFRHTINKSQLALFKLVPAFIANRQWFWLRDVVYSAGFATVDNHGYASTNGVVNNAGIRPVFGIVAT